MDAFPPAVTLEREAVRLSGSRCHGNGRWNVKIEGDFNYRVSGRTVDYLITLIKWLLISLSFYTRINKYFILLRRVLVLTFEI